MARLGSSDPVEIRSDLSELIEGFDLSHFGSAPTKFDVEDLFPLTAHYLQTRPLAEVAGKLAEIGVPQDLAEPFWLMARDNIITLDDLERWWALCRDGAEPMIDEADRAFVAEALALLPEGPFDAGTWASWTAAVREATGRKGKALFMPLRKALTGQESGPEMAALMPLLQRLPKRG